MGPLMCWDIYMDAYHRRIRLFESLQKIRDLAKSSDWNIEWDLEKQLLTEQKVILVTDVSLRIRFASSNLYEMNGYNAEDVIGKSPRIFQGELTEVETRQELREAIIKRIPFQGSIVNYRKNGTTYNCLVEEYPVWSKAGKLAHFIAFEKVA